MFDYTVFYDQATDTFVELESGVLSTSYVATGLTPGLTYKFKVKSRNSFGFSDFSSVLSLYCAFIPAVPAAPATSVVANQVIIDWSAPANNGSPITSYRVKIQAADS